VSRDGERIALTYTEFSLLELLFREPGRVVPRAEILEQLNLAADLLEESGLELLPAGYRCGEPKPVFPRLEPIVAPEV
jgi:hypothetical protein